MGGTVLLKRKYLRDDDDDDFKCYFASQNESAVWVCAMVKFKSANCERHLHNDFTDVTFYKRWKGRTERVRTYRTDKFMGRLEDGTTKRLKSSLPEIHREHVAGRQGRRGRHDKRRMPMRGTDHDGTRRDATSGHIPYISRVWRLYQLVVRQLRAHTTVILCCRRHALKVFMFVCEPEKENKTLRRPMDLTKCF